MGVPTSGIEQITVITGGVPANMVMLLEELFL